MSFKAFSSFFFFKQIIANNTHPIARPISKNCFNPIDIITCKQSNSLKNRNPIFEITSNKNEETQRFQNGVTRPSFKPLLFPYGI